MLVCENVPGNIRLKTKSEKINCLKETQTNFTKQLHLTSAIALQFPEKLPSLKN